MDVMQRGIITLMRSAVTGEKLALPEGFDIDTAYPKIRAHHLVALAYAGAVNCGVDPAQASMQKLFLGYCKAVQISERQMNALAQVYAAFDEAGIHYLPVKGCNMKALYPRPEMRTMGDADILIRMEQYAEIREIMTKLGYSEGKEAQEHMEWNSDSLCVELHRYLIAPKFKSYYAYFQEGWAFAKRANGTHYTMSDEDAFVFLFAHFAKHYSYAGIGCRHVIDLWVYLRHYTQMDENALKDKLQKLQLWDFYQNIRKLIAVWFADQETDERTEFITEAVFASGSWGYESKVLIAKGAWDAGKNGGTGGGRLGYLRRCVFPERERLRREFPVLKKAPALLPVIWFVRLLYKLICLPVIFRTHRRNLQMLNTDRIEERRKALRYVGLTGDE